MPGVARRNRACAREPQAPSPRGARDAERLLDLVRELADVVPDPEGPAPIHSPDPADDYLLALAAREQVPLVSGDEHLLGLGGRAPVFSPREFLEQLRE